MNKVKQHFIMLLPLLALVFTMVVLVGCSSAPRSTPEPAPSFVPESRPTPPKDSLPSTADAIEVNESIIFCQVQLFGEWDGEYPRTMKVMVYESSDVKGKVNYAKEKLGKQIDVTLDDDVDWLMLGQQISAHVELRSDPEGGTSFYMWDLVH